MQTLTKSIRDFGLSIFSLSSGDQDTIYRTLTDSVVTRKTTSGENVTPSKSLTLSAYFACIHVISSDIAKMPLNTYKRLKPRGKEKAFDHPVYKLLHTKPNEETTPYAFKQALVAGALGWGNGYAEIERDSQSSNQKN
jgi:phage portal protein BeeE